MELLVKTKSTTTSASAQQVTKAMTAKKTSMTARVILVKTRPTAVMGLTATSVFVLQVLMEPFVSTISTNVPAQTAKTMLLVWIK